MSNRAEDLVDAVRALPRQEQLRLVERIVRDFAEGGGGNALGNPAHATSLIGLFSGDTDVIDQIAEQAMAAREMDPLRRPGA
jgi:hypothetical protein